MVYILLHLHPESEVVVLVEQQIILVAMEVPEFIPTLVAVVAVLLVHLEMEGLEVLFLVRVVQDLPQQVV